jgi:hypothetical protein
MNARSFFDTNVLVYADEKAAPAKQRRALELVAEHRRAGTVGPESRNLLSAVPSFVYLRVLCGPSI